MTQESKKEEIVPSDINSDPEGQTTKAGGTALTTQISEEEHAKALKKASDFEKAFQIEKKKREEAELRVKVEPQKDDEDIPDWFKKAEAKKQEESLKSVKEKAFNEFIEANPELHQVNDQDGSKYSKFKAEVEAKWSLIHSDDTKAKSDLGFIFNQLFPKSTKPNESLQDSYIGGGNSAPEHIDKADKMKRPLTKIEQDAVGLLVKHRGISFQEAEKIYRTNL